MMLGLVLSNAGLSDGNAQHKDRDRHQPEWELRVVPAIVIIHTFCASRDTQVSYGRCLLISQYQNTIILFVCPAKILHKHFFYFLLGVIMVPRETGNNAYAKFWRNKQNIVLWYF